MTGSDEEIEGALSRGDGGGAAGEETVDWEGYEVWKGHLSDGAMKAIMSGGKDLALKAIGEEFGKMGDDVRRRMGSMDYAVGAQEDGEDQVTLFTLGRFIPPLANLERLVQQVASVVELRSTSDSGGLSAGEAGEPAGAENAAQKEWLEEKAGYERVVDEINALVGELRIDNERLREGMVARRVEHEEAQRVLAEGLKVNATEMEREEEIGRLKKRTKEQAVELEVQGKGLGEEIKRLQEELGAKKGDFAEAQKAVAVNLRASAEAEADTSGA